MSLYALCLAGPTASGKSALALWAAGEIRADLINTDSLQVYREFPLLTARPHPQEEALCPHHLYGFLEPTQAYSVAKWLSAVEDLLPRLETERRVPLFVGGTGLYFKALLEGLSAIPEVSEEIRAHVRGLFEEGGMDALAQKWTQYMPDLGPPPPDPQRFMRALEVFLSTGRPLAFWQAQKGFPLIDSGASLQVVLMPSRAFLHKRALARLEAAFPTSLLQMKVLLEKEPDLERAPVLQALGAKELLQVCQGTLSQDEALARAFIRTRQYIKRQCTWFFHQMAEAYFIEETDFSAQKEALSALLEENFSQTL